jgi:hypothetical protein
MSLFWLVAALLAAGLVYRGSRVWTDAGLRDFELLPRLQWAIWGSIAASRYWWGARIEAMSSKQRAGLLVEETERLGLSRADGLRCPLCGAEVPAAWTLSPDNQPDVAPGPVLCPCCDFRLDSCRHCTHFLPGRPGGSAEFVWQRDDVTAGRCSRYREWQPVERACAPDMARQLRDRGYERLRAPKEIQDSCLPPDHCTAFRADRKRLRSSDIHWPDARQVALLRLLGVGLDHHSGTDPHQASRLEPWLF